MFSISVLKNDHSEIDFGLTFLPGKTTVGHPSLIVIRLRFLLERKIRLGSAVSL